MDTQDDILESLDSILSEDDADYVVVKAWGGKNVRLGSLTAGQMIAFLENNDKPEQRRRNGLLLITQSLVDKKGKRLVDPNDLEAVKVAIEKLKGRSAKVNGDIVERILLLNGMGKKDANETAKNVSGGAAIGASPTDSPSQPVK
jgi:hypothetical protein